MPGSISLKIGDFVWSPAGEGEWCLVYFAKSDSNWKYVVPSTSALVNAAATIASLKRQQIHHSERVPPGRPEVM